MEDILKSIEDNFNQQKDWIQDNFMQESDIQKGKKAALGEVRMYSGVAWKKVSEAGNPNKDWQRVKKGEGVATVGGKVEEKKEESGKPIVKIFEKPDMENPIYSVEHNGQVTYIQRMENNDYGEWREVTKNDKYWEDRYPMNVKTDHDKSFLGFTKVDAVDSLVKNGFTTFKHKNKSYKLSDLIDFKEVGYYNDPNDEYAQDLDIYFKEDGIDWRKDSSIQYLDPNKVVASDWNNLTDKEGNKKVDRYTSMGIEKMPPIIAVKMKNGEIQAVNGIHRVYAAQNLGSKVLLL